MTTLTTDDVKNITQYLPTSLKRSLNKEYKRENNDAYCQFASQIYQDDMNFVKNNYNQYVLYYYNNDYDYEAYFLMNNVSYVYKIQLVDNYYILTIKNKIDDYYKQLIDIDLTSQYLILKNRGCEDVQKDFSKLNILKKLLNVFTTYFNPDDMKDLLYLYVFLHSNCVLLKYDEPITTPLYFKIHKLPKKDFLNDIYDLYNTLYVHFDLLKDL